MAVRKMHDREVDIDAQLVHRLLLTQFTDLCDQTLREVRSTGTVNAIYRLGDDLCVRLPRLQQGAGDPSGRTAFRGALDVDEGTWARARGFALHQARLIIPYYPETNPGFVPMAKRTLEEVLLDLNT